MHLINLYDNIMDHFKCTSKSNYNIVIIFKYIDNIVIIFKYSDNIIIIFKYIDNRINKFEYIDIYDIIMMHKYIYIEGILLREYYVKNITNFMI